MGISVPQPQRGESQNRVAVKVILSFITKIFTKIYEDHTFYRMRTCARVEGCDILAPSKHLCRYHVIICCTHSTKAK